MLKEAGIPASFWDESVFSGMVQKRCRNKKADCSP